MTEITLSASDLAKALYNALSFTDRDDDFNEIRIRIGTELEVTGASRMSIGRDIRPATGQQIGSAEVFVSTQGPTYHSPAEDFHKAVDKLKGDACLMLVDGSLTIRDTEVAVETVKPSTPLWGMVDELLKPTAPIDLPTSFCFKPERFGAFNRLKVKTGAIADCYLRSQYGMHFKIGETLQCMIAHMDREIAMKHFAEKKDVDVSKLFWTEEDFAA